MSNTQSKRQLLENMRSASFVVSHDLFKNKASHKATHPSLAHYTNLTDYEPVFFKADDSSMFYGMSHLRAFFEKYGHNQDFLKLVPVSADGVDSRAFCSEDVQEAVDFLAQETVKIFKNEQVLNYLCKREQELWHGAESLSYYKDTMVAVMASFYAVGLGCVLAGIVLPPLMLPMFAIGFATLFVLHAGEYGMRHYFPSIEEKRENAKLIGEVLALPETLREEPEYSTAKRVY